MKKLSAFSNRNIKELIRDPLTIVFMIFLPLFVFLIMIYLTNALQIPNPAFSLSSFTPATIVFSFSFTTLFSSMLISKDIKSSFLTRLLASPLTASNYIIGYIVPMLLLSFIQTIILFITSIIAGLNLSIGVLYAIICTIPVSLIFSSLGLLIGSFFSEKQSLLIANIIIQVNAFTSGMWFDLNLIGGAYKTISYILPFAHSSDLLNKILNGNYNDIWINLVVVFAYATVFTVLAIFAFRKKMKN